MRANDDLPEVSDELAREYREIFKIKNEAQRWNALAEWSERVYNGPQVTPAEQEQIAETTSSKFETNGDIFSDRVMDGYELLHGIIPQQEESK